MMKKAIVAVLITVFASCETSEELKSATLQKVSHETFPCNYYVAEFAFDGGRRMTDGNSSSYENTQQVEISSAGYQYLKPLVGKKVVFDYKDRGMELCGPTKILTSIDVAQ